MDSNQRKTYRSRLVIKINGEIVNDFPVDNEEVAVNVFETICSDNEDKKVELEKENVQIFSTTLLRQTSGSGQVKMEDFRFATSN